MLDEMLIPVEQSQVYLLYAENGNEKAAKDKASFEVARGGKILFRNPKYYTRNESLELTIGEGQSKIPIRGVFILKGSVHAWEIKRDYEAEGRSVQEFEPPEGPAPVIDLAATPPASAPSPVVGAKPSEVQTFADAFGALEEAESRDDEAPKPKRKRAPRKKKVAAKPAE